MTDERVELRESGWSLPPDQHAVPPTQRKIGEGAVTDGPNGQSMTATSPDGPAISRLDRIDEPEDEPARDDAHRHD